MFDYAALEALSAVLATGSFEAAAARLRVTPSAVSQRIRALEDRVGAVLVVRGAPCTGTEAGQRLARHAEVVALLEAELAPPEAAPVLRIAVNADSLATWVLPALAAVPDRLFDLVIDDQDHSADWLRRGEVVAAVTSSARAVPGCDVRPLGALHYLATAAPAFVAQHFPAGISAAALARAPALVFNEKDGLQAAWLQQVTGQSPPLRAHHIASTTAFVEAAELGLGWGMNPEVLVRGAIAAGRLVPLHPEPLAVALYWQSARRLAGPLAPLTRAMRTAAARVLRPA
ncbi:LysR family transcriptional regulator (chromosome initiation inhibitor) [Rhodobacter sp. 140A]|nr:LysR family transcriptional regulator (chromosome initiation inhibitor) [Rhodobacter sp. 140A]